MKQRAKPVQPMVYSFDKTPKQRILEASDKIFRQFGIRAGIGAIAYHAHSNTDTVIKHFGYRERLVALFVKSLIEDAGKARRELEIDYPDDAETKLRGWIWNEMQDDPFSAATLLSRSAAELQDYPKDKLLVEIENYWQAERLWVADLCSAARFREPGELADKLLLLVHGTRNERKAFGYDGPSQRLSQAGDDLMVAHGAVRKPPFFDGLRKE
jgi:AcrR family transcriptional regulator